MSLANIYQVIGFTIAFYIGQCFPLYGLTTNKKNRILIFVLVFVFNIVLGFFYQWFFDFIKATFFPNFNYFTIVRYLAIYLTSFFIFYFCSRCHFLPAIYAVNFGYCFQHSMQYIFQLLIQPLKIQMFSIPGIIIRTLFLLLYTLLLWLLTHKRFKLIDEHNLHQGIHIVLISIFGILLTIIMNSIAYTISVNLKEEFIVYYVLVSSGIGSVLLLILNIMILERDVTNAELMTIKKMLHQQKNFFSQEKAVIEELNIKSHDLKHKLISLKENMINGESKEIDEAISLYDSFIKSGNDAIDVILTSKEIYCKQNKIRFTTMVDGKSLSFIKESDLYSLLGNILDNAIEASLKIKDEERRVITLTIKEEFGFISISEENYYEGNINFENNIPQTSKENKNYHGFGLKSIFMIVKKYSGTYYLNVKDNIFKLNIMFPKA